MAEKTSQKQTPIKVRNWMNVYAYLRNGAGAMKSKKQYSRKQKHKGKSE